jgi:hypothetical protein
MRARVLHGKDLDMLSCGLSVSKGVNSPPGTSDADAVARLVGIEGGVVSGVFNLESSGVRASDWRPRHDKRYHEA